MEFPIYRKYSNLHSYFIITSRKNWTEYKRMGKSYLKYEFTAQQYPEMLFIQDLIACIPGIEMATVEEIEPLVNLNQP